MAKYQDTPEFEAEKADFFAKFDQPQWRADLRMMRVWLVEDRLAFGMMIAGLLLLLASTATAVAKYGF